MKRLPSSSAAAALIAIALAACERGDETDVATDAPVDSPSPTTDPAQTSPDVPVKLYAMDCGRIHVSDAARFSDEGAYDGEARDLTNPCYLVRHPRGDLLWDTGVPEAVAGQPEGITDGAFTIRMPVKLTDQLAQLNLAPGDIEYVSISHSHSDHAGNLELFKDATWIVDRDEYDWMFRQEARQSDDFANYDAMENANIQFIDGDQPHDVFGDGSVVIHQAPGHTPGHTALLVDLPGYGPALLAGDMYHLKEAREKRTVPVNNTSRDETLASMDRIEELARTRGAKVIRQHVPDDLESMPAFPQPAE